MNKLFRYVLIISLVVLLSIILLLWWSSSNQSTNNVTPIIDELNIQTRPIELINSNQQLQFSTKENKKISVRDFKSDPGITPWGDSSTLVLGDGLINNDQAFQIFYYELDQSFSISVLQEPIGDIRKVAEAQLLERLQISQADACKLFISVTVPSFVSENMSGQNLGLSFCPDAIQL